MSKIPTALPNRYISSNGRTISKSRTHKDLYIIDTENGKWFAINSSDYVMRKSNPPKIYGQKKKKEQQK